MTERRRPETHRCATCGARIKETDSACPICGAQVLEMNRTYFAAQIPHIILSLVVIAAVVASGIWFFRPAIALGPEPTQETSTAPALMPWPTMTYTDTATPTTTSTPTPPATPTPFCVPHTVEKSENIELVAEKYNVSPLTIRAHNNIHVSELLAPGDRLCIPVSREQLPSLTPPPTWTPTPVIYTVQRGDNLGEIAVKFDTTVELILEANDLEESAMLSLGRELLIPRTFATPTPETPTATMTSTLPPPTVTPTHTETPRPYRYPAPALLYPLPDDSFHGSEADIVLNWSAVALLRPDQWYILNVYYLHEGVRQRMAQIRTKDTSWRLPASAYRYHEDFYAIEWSVIIVRELETGEVSRICPRGEERTFFWY
jgi:LysM repeat protein/DNA-directed RNA polymerase subunit RPC12/RpoP